jgi:hypothetical protein
MAKRATSLTSAAGEHFIAFRLSAMGFPVALTRGGSPTIDLMVGDLAGNAAISLQVKTSTGAWRPSKRNPQKSHWEWDVGNKTQLLRGESIYYVFVDLKWGDGKVTPDAFVVPSHVVADCFAGTKYPRNMFWIMGTNRELYLEAWTPIMKRLAG